MGGNLELSHLNDNVRPKSYFTHSYNVPILLERKTRKTTHNGTIKYKGEHYPID